MQAGDSGSGAGCPPDREWGGFTDGTEGARRAGIVFRVLYSTISIFTSGKVLLGENFCPAFIFL